MIYKIPMEDNRFFGRDLLQINLERSTFLQYTEIILKVIEDCYEKKEVLLFLSPSVFS